MSTTAPGGDSVPGTVTIGEVGGTSWQAVVVGAGPAGTATAWRLARAGWRVLILDRATFPRAKVCGCCLSPLAAAELGALGACDGSLPSVGLGSVRLASGGRAATIPLSRGMVVSREMLDTWLLRRAILAGCAWLPEARVVAIDDRDAAEDAPTIHVAAGGADAPSREIGAGMVVVATGLSDGIRERRGLRGVDTGAVADRTSRIGLGALLDPDASDLPAGELVMAVSGAGYCGLVRLDDGRIDVAAAVDRRALAASPPADAVAEILGRSLGRGFESGLARALESARFRATPALTRRRGPIAGVSGRVVRVGDAVGYVEPFTGEGIGWALLSARLLAESIGRCRADGVGVGAAGAYAAAHRRALDPCHRRCRMVAGAVRRPSVVAATVIAARRWPGAAGAIVPLFVGAGRGGHGP